MKQFVLSLVEGTRVGRGLTLGLGDKEHDRYHRLKTLKAVADNILLT